MADELRKTGVQLVAEGASEFKKTLDDASKSVEDFSKNVTTATDAVAKENKKFSNSIGDLTTAQEAATTTVKESLAQWAAGFSQTFSKIGANFPKAIKGIAAFGKAAVGVFTKITGVASSVKESLAQWSAGFSQTFSKIGANFPKAIKGIAAFGKAAVGVFTKIIGVASIVIGVFAAIAVVVAGIVAEMVRGFIKIAKSAINFINVLGGLASEYETLENKALAWGHYMGYSNEQVKGAISSMSAMGISTQSAAENIATMARYGIDLSKSIELVKLAQASAMLTGQSYDATLSTLITSIAQQNTEELKSLGISVDLQGAYIAKAAALGVSVDALNEEQRAQAVLDVVLQQSTGIIRAFGDAALTTAQQTELIGAYINNIKLSIGKNFVPAIKIAKGAILSLFQEVYKYTSDPNSGISRFFEKIGFAVAVAAQIIANFVPQIVSWVDSLAGKMSDKLELSDESFGWGFDTIVAWAEGMMRAAIEVVTKVLNAIASLVASLMKAKSPPPFLKDIGKWGMKTMEEWLKGFTNADFSVLGTLKSTISSALSSLSTNTIGNAKQSLWFQKALIGVIATGKGEEQLLAKLAEATKKYGDAIVELTKNNLDYLRSIKAVDEALKVAEKAYGKETELTGELSKALDEYNRMKISGAGAGQLQAKAKEIENIRKRRAEQDAIVRAKVEEARLAQIEADKKKEALDLQKQMVDELIDMQSQQLSIAQMIADSMASAAQSLSALSGGELGSGLSFAMPNLTEMFENGEFQKKVEETANRLGEIIKTKLDESFGPGTPVGTAIADLKIAWDNLGKILGNVDWKTTIDDLTYFFTGPVWGGFVAAIPTLVGALLGFATSVASLVSFLNSPAMKFITNPLGTIAGNIFKDVPGIEKNAKGQVGSGWGPIGGASAVIRLADYLFKEMFGDSADPATLKADATALMTGSSAEFATSLVDGVSAGLVTAMATTAGVTTPLADTIAEMQFGDSLNTVKDDTKAIIDPAVAEAKTAISEAIGTGLVLTPETDTGGVGGVPTAKPKLSDYILDNLFDPNSSDTLAADVTSSLAPGYEALKTSLDITLNTDIPTIINTAAANAPALYNSVTQPAIDEFIEMGTEATNLVNGGLTNLSDFFEEDGAFRKRMVEVATVILPDLDTAFENVSDAVKRAYENIRKFMKALKEIIIPAWAELHSPPPLAQAFTMSAEEMLKTNRQLANLRKNFSGLKNSAVVAGQNYMPGANSVTNNNTNYNVNVSANYAGVQAPAKVSDDVMMSLRLARV